jgi:hypothetical protein
MVVPAQGADERARLVDDDVAFPRLYAYVSALEMQVVESRVFDIVVKLGVEKQNQMVRSRQSILSPKFRPIRPNRCDLQLSDGREHQYLMSLLRQ